VKNELLKNYFVTIQFTRINTLSSIIYDRKKIPQKVQVEL